jgi:hypothetical protein
VLSQLVHGDERAALVWYRAQPCSPKVKQSDVVDCGIFRRPSKSIVEFVLAQALKGVLVEFHAQRVEQRATHLLSARKFIRWADGYSQIEIFLNLGVLAAPLQMALLCNKPAISTDSTIPLFM